ncbi:MAG: porin family protein [Gammaproteobacteria bacterium]|nr:porin family protein [Gammaproteobacteria bacterium]
MQSDFKLKYFQLLVILFLSAVTFPIWAFDNDRKGFALGLGIGAQSTTVDTYVIDGQHFSDDYEGEAASVRMGLGFSNQFIYYFSVEMSMYEAADGINNETVSYTSSMTGIVAAYYFSSKAPSAYIVGGVGWGNLSFESTSFTDGDDGSAFILGGGYEFMPHHNVELNLFSTSIPSKYVEIESIDTLSTQLMYQYVFY